MRKFVIIILHFGFWLCYSLIVFIIIALIANPQKHLTLKTTINILVGFFYLPAILSFYTFYFILFPKFLLKKKIIKFCLYGILTPIAAGVFGLLIMNLYITDSTELELIIIVTPAALMAGIVALVIRGFIAWYDGIKLQQELSTKNHKMEMALIKAQLDPHFLFNTLNNIDILIQKNPKDASTYLNKLSDIMRFMLFETKTEKIKLSKELEYIERYIELQKIRSSNPNFVKLTIKGEQSDKKISPMVFIPFIENAFKHVTDKTEENAIDIQIKIDENEVQFECANNSNKKLEPINQYNGLGNELIQKRLSLLYPNRHNLMIDNQANLYKVNLIINYE